MMSRGDTGQLVVYGMREGSPADEVRLAVHVSNTVLQRFTLTIEWDPQAAWPPDGRRQLRLVGAELLTVR